MSSPLDRVARELARDLLRDLEERWRHTEGVAACARYLAGELLTDEASRERLVAAAWLHDIGYNPTIGDTGFHPLDGAHHLLRLGWPRDICALVAHHSGARFVAAACGLDAALAAFPFEDSLETDLLTCADQTIGPGGHRFSLEKRAADMLRRHGPDSPNARAHAWRYPYLQAATGRVHDRLLHRLHQHT